VWFQVFYAVKGGTGSQDPQFSNKIDATGCRLALKQEPCNCSIALEEPRIALNVMKYNSFIHKKGNQTFRAYLAVAQREH
jgi:hypothetical protein